MSNMLHPVKHEPQYGSNIYQYPIPDPFLFKFRKVENGFVLVKDGKEYVFEDQNALLAFIQESLK